jgi:predicted O-methyltransferase YrrM
MADFRNLSTDYIIDLFAKEDELLLDILEQQRKAGGPMMNIGADQGKLLSLLVNIYKPKIIVEIGSYFAYSSIWLGRALQKSTPDGILYCVEKSVQQAEIIASNLTKADLDTCTRVINSSGLEALMDFKNEKRSIDMIFIDADKANYPEYYKHSKDLLPSGGLMLIDNVLGMHGREVLDLSNERKTVQAIRKVNELVSQDQDFESTIIDMHGGMLISVKK